MYHDLKTAIDLAIEDAIELAIFHDNLDDLEMIFNVMNEACNRIENKLFKMEFDQHD